MACILTIPRLQTYCSDGQTVDASCQRIQVERQCKPNRSSDPGPLAIFPESLWEDLRRQRGDDGATSEAADQAKGALRLAGQEQVAS